MNHKKPGDHYSKLEKKLHNLAFKSWEMQESLSHLEDTIYKRKLADVEIQKPVFITSLPRAGTTLLLEICNNTGEFSTHTYRHMPFIHIPIFWDKFSRLFKKTPPPRERAHGDDMIISVDSPEAFEEVIWHVYWKSRYKKEYIIPWPIKEHSEFQQHFKNHIRKHIYLSQLRQASATRYISKNNLNISRISYLRKLFPDSIIIVPVRHPVQHAASMLRQHLSFLKIHATDKFADKYMKDLGHFDFGNNLRPVDFNAWFSSTKKHNASSLAFWLEYWINAFQYLIDHNEEDIIFVSYDALCREPEIHLEQLSSHLQVNNHTDFMKNAARFYIPKSHPVDTADIPQSRLSEAEDIYLHITRSVS